jgi:hypothetical protein
LACSLDHWSVSILGGFLKPESVRPGWVSSSPVSDRFSGDELILRIAAGAAQATKSFFRTLFRGIRKHLPLRERVGSKAKAVIN